MRLNRFVPAVLALCASVGVASAGNFSFTGTFTHDDQLEIFIFTAPSASFVARTWSYAGGTNANNQLIPAGGFDPVLSVFDATGGLVASSALQGANNDGAGVAADPTTLSAFDSLLAISALNAGHTYALVLSEFDNWNFGSTFGTFFSQAGQGNFTATEFPCGGTAFCDSNLAQRTGNWAVDIDGVRTAIDTAAVTPEPASMLLFAAGITSLALWRRRRNSV